MAPQTQYKSTRKELIREAMLLRHTYGEQYRTALQQLDDLLAEKRAKKIKPLEVVPKYVTRKFPKIPFFDIESEDEALEYIEEMEDKEISKMISEIKYDVLYGYEYRTVVGTVYAYKYQIRHHGERKSPFGDNPDFCKAKSRCKKGAYYRD